MTYIVQLLPLRYLNHTLKSRITSLLTIKPECILFYIEYTVMRNILFKQKPLINYYNYRNSVTIRCIFKYWPYGIILIFVFSFKRLWWKVNNIFLWTGTVFYIFLYFSRDLSHDESVKAAGSGGRRPLPI